MKGYKMSDFGGGYDRFADIRSHAHWAYTNLDSRFEPDEIDYADHLRDKIKHPTTGMLAMREQERNYGIDSPIRYKSRVNYFEKRNPKTKMLADEFNSIMKKTYPKTRNIRKYIVKHDRVKLDEVVKDIKTSKFMKKLIYFLYKTK